MKRYFSREKDMKFKDWERMVTLDESVTLAGFFFRTEVMPGAYFEYF